MSATGSTSLSPGVEQQLLSLPLQLLEPHPLNANEMSEDQLAKLTANVAREGRYPPLIVRPLGDGRYQVLDGHQRLTVLVRLGSPLATCYPWPCDDATAMVLLATLNRLRGEDLPSRRASLLAELRQLVSLEELELLLPESSAELQATLDLLSLDSEALLAAITAAHDAALRDAHRQIAFAVLAEDEPIIEQAVALAASTLQGSDRRGRALARVCRSFLERANG